MNLRESLAPVLGPRAALVRRSFDIIGTVAVLEIPPEFTRHQKLIAEKLMELYPHLTAVCKKTSARKGSYRIRRLALLAGRTTETVHKEHGLRLALDVRKVYFSPRESTERQRVAAQVRAGETVLVMFAGIGPYALAIARRQPQVKQVAGIESNAAAVQFFRKNIQVNRLGEKVSAAAGTVQKRAPAFTGACDRVVMPLPTGAHRFLPLAFACLRPGGTLHFYSVGGRLSPFTVPQRQLAAAAQKARKKVTILRRQAVLPFSPGKTKVCLDARVS